MPVPPALPRLERLVMEQVWATDRATVRSVMEVLNDDAARSPRAYTTVLTVLRRLEGKGLVERVREGRTDTYVPTLGRDDYLRVRADAEIDALLDEYGELAVVQFARRATTLDSALREQLRRLAEE